MTINNRIAGTFRLISPLHVASPDGSLIRKMKTLKGVDEKIQNETPTVQRQILTNKGQTSITYFPANDFRGRLRRKAGKRLMDYLAVSAKVSPELYAGITCGANHAKPDDAALTVEEAVRAKNNVFMGLFGSGARILESRYSVNDLVPITMETIGIGAVPQAYAETDFENFLPVRHDGEAINAWSLVESRQFIRIDDMHRVKNVENIMACVDDASNVIASIQINTIANRTARAGSKDAATKGIIKKSEIIKKEDVGNMASYQAIMAGTPMYFQLDFDNSVSDAHVGLMLLALQDLVQEQRLGGWCRAGLGRFAATLTLTRNNESMEVFSESCAHDSATLSEATNVFVVAAENGISECTSAGMLEFFTNRPKKIKPGKDADADGDA